MIGVDFGSSSVKWFDGERFGEGIPKGRNFNVGVSSRELFVKFSEYPICRGSSLKKLILNDVSIELSVEPDEISVAFCPVERLQKGCRFLIFVEKRENLQRIPEEILNSSQITVDLLGGINSLIKHYLDTFTLIDAGKGKVAVVNVQDGSIRGFEVFRGGFDYYVSDLSFLKEFLSDKVFLSGGGALSREFRESLRKVTDFEIPEIEPFGEKTPLFLNAYGLYHFRKSPCKAFFKALSLFSSEFFQKNRKLIVLSSFSLLLSLTLITSAEVLNLLRAKNDYYQTKRELNRELSRVLGERVLAPDIQVSQKLESLKQLADFLRLDAPSLLFYLDGISKSVVKGVNVISVDGSVSSGSFKLKGRAENSRVLDDFVKKLKTLFAKVSVSAERRDRKGIFFTILLGVNRGV